MIETTTHFFNSEDIEEIFSDGYIDDDEIRIQETFEAKLSKVTYPRFTTGDQTAAIGSIIPGAGTAVEAVIGMCIDIGINWDICDWDGDGKKDSLVDGAKFIVDDACDYVGDLFSELFK